MASTLAHPFREHRRRRGRHAAPRRLGLLAVLGAGVAVAALVLASALTWMGSGPDAQRGGASPAPNRPGAESPAAPNAAATAAARWAADNLPAGSAVLASSELAALLTGLHPSTTCPSGGFLLADDAVRIRATHQPTLADCLARSLPVARFEGRVEIRHVMPDPDAAARTRKAGFTDRSRAGTALASNSAIVMAAPTRRLIRAGALDLRAAAVLAALAARHPIAVLSVIGDPPEVAAGLPARTVEVVYPDLDGLFAVVRAVAPDYRPSQVTPASNGSVRLSWPFRATPPGVLR